ncbi:NAD(P)-dependent oxidoreductase [Microvirga aerophila]|uniref:Dehydrogenase/oxidoreductase n=1 Tax=Microvirga aerophila TaxID=670291 RepID=A0A512BQV5_9HYPH|nr:NAD(P)-dependent oxidoreductase [Microvirga aerophila]GEO14330.1 dehydrogenase/oxidoreductase [Microvirga aerophila]
MGTNVGLIGIGLMGTALAHRLIGAGFDVVGFDLDSSKRDALKTAGGHAAASIAEVGQRCDRVLIAVLTVAQVEEVTEGADGLAATERPITAICAATCDPERIATLASRLVSRGMILLDAPVSGSSAQVAKGEGLGLVAGDRSEVNCCDDILGAIYPRRVFVGPAGDGSKAKLAVNLALGLNRLALAESLVFAERMGLNPSTFLDIARQSAAYSQIMDVKGMKMIEGDFAPQGRIVQSRKDFGLILGEAERVGQRLPLAEVLMDILKGCVESGEGDWDNSAVIQEVRRRKV